MWGFQQSLELVSKTFCKVEKEEQMQKILEDMMTPQEIEDLAERVRIFQELAKGKTQRDISDELGISVTTVNRGSRVLKYGSGEIKKIV